jgi:hypothetical protein
MPRSCMSYVRLQTLCAVLSQPSEGRRRYLHANSVYFTVCYSADSGEKEITNADIDITARLSLIDPFLTDALMFKVTFH